MSVDKPIQKITIADGNGKDFAASGRVVSIHYTGKLVDFGQKTFDSSVGKRPFTFTVGKGDVIRGLDEGIQQMSLNEKAWIVIHYSYAYGEKGAPGPEYPITTFAVSA